MSHRLLNRFVINMGIALSALGMATQEAQADDSAHKENLTTLNQSYLIAYASGDVQQFSEMLSENYRETAANGTQLDKATFLKKIGERASGPNLLSVKAEELEIRIIGDTAVINAIPVYTFANGATRAGGRYTDVYVRIDGQWLCVAAHLGGSS